MYLSLEWIRFFWFNDSFDFNFHCAIPFESHLLQTRGIEYEKFPRRGGFWEREEVLRGWTCTTRVVQWLGWVFAKQRKKERKGRKKGGKEERGRRGFGKERGWREGKGKEVISMRKSPGEEERRETGKALDSEFLKKSTNSCQGQKTARGKTQSPYRKLI